MTTQPEGKLSAKIMDAIRLEGHFCFKVHGGDTMMSGLPDIVVCARGWFVGLEVKRPGLRANTSARQRLVHGRIERAGGGAYVVTSVEEALAAINETILNGP